MIRESRAERKPFCSSRSLAPYFFLCASDTWASSPWKIKAPQEAQEPLQAQQR